MPDRPVVTFPTWARVVLSLVFSLAGYLAAGEVFRNEIREALSVLVVFLSSAGVVPASRDIVAKISPQFGFVLTALASIGAYVVNVVGLDPTLRGVLVALLALAGALGITPPQGHVRAT